MRWRFYQLSLRTLLLLVAVVCAWLGYNTNIVHARKQVESQALNSRWMYLEGSLKRPTRPMPWLRRVMGDKHVLGMSYPVGTPEELLKRFQRHFPEARLIGFDDLTSISLTLIDENEVEPIEFAWMSLPLDENGFAKDEENIVRTDGRPLKETKVGDTLVVDGEQMQVTEFSIDPPYQLYLP